MSGLGAFDVVILVNQGPGASISGGLRMFAVEIVDRAPSNGPDMGYQSGLFIVHPAAHATASIL